METTLSFRKKRSKAGGQALLELTFTLELYLCTNRQATSKDRISSLNQ